MSHSISNSAHAPGASQSWGPSDALIAVVALHGRTQTPDFIRELADAIGVKGLRWEAPAAHGNEWYSHRFMDPQLLEDPELDDALDAVTAAFDRLESQGFARENIALLGFSQGACLGVQWTLQHPGRLAGLLCFTGGYIGEVGVQPELSAGAYKDTPVLISGPQDDEWVPLTRMQETEQLFRESGARVTAHYLPPGSHSVTDIERHLAASLLQDAVRVAVTQSSKPHPT